jgi:hypothetical protein
VAPVASGFSGITPRFSRLQMPAGILIKRLSQSQQTLASNYMINSSAGEARAQSLMWLKGDYFNHEHVRPLLNLPFN